MFVPRVVLILQEKNGPIFLKKNYFCIFVIRNSLSTSARLGFPKIFLMLRPGRFLNSSPKLFPLNFVCYFSLSVKKMPSIMSKAPTDNELSLQPSVSRKQKTFLKLSMGPNHWKW